MKFKEDNARIQFNYYKRHLSAVTKTTLAPIIESNTCQNLIKAYCWKFHKNTLFNPLNTLIIFMKQVFSADKSCKNAVSGLLTTELSDTGKIIGSSTGSYVKARQRLPLIIIQELIKHVGVRSLSHVPVSWRPYGRDLKVFDGTTITMPDTPANRERFPKHSNQNKSIGFPLARLVIVMSLITGAVIDYAIGPCKGKGTGEASLLRKILGCIETNDIVLGDRYYPHFFLMCDLKNKGVDGVFRAAAQRVYDFRQGKRLGKYEHIVLWEKPKRPEWMSDAEYNKYPKTLPIREFKNSGLIYVTTFLDPKAYPKKELCALYKKRWQVETNLNYIKTVMSMNHLTCQTPDMVEKELGVHFWAYNMVRYLIVLAAIKKEVLPTQISFKGTIQLINHFTTLFHNKTIEHRNLLFEQLLECIAKNKIGNRPGRAEPRAVKQRPKSFPVLKKNREYYRAVITC